MVEAYFDESGIHDGAQICVVGGYYGGQNDWRKFERQWTKVLRSYSDVSDIGFHAKEFFQRSGPYRHWDQAKRDKFLQRLVNTITRNTIFPIGYGIVVSHFMELPTVTRAWFSGAKFTIKGKQVSSGCPNKSYYVPFQFCVLDASKVFGATEKIHFYAGLDRTFSEYAGDLYRYLSQDPRLNESYRRALGGITFPLAKDTPGLQAADLLVNRLYRYGEMQLDRGHNLPVHPLLSQLIRNKKPNQRIKVLTKKDLNEIEGLGKRVFLETLGSV